MHTIIFPGQGAQHKGMGEGLFDVYPNLTAAADDILGYSVKTLCLENPEDRLKRTCYTQPAMYVVSALMYHQWLDQHGTLPDFLAGHSIGEYCALFAAGAFNFETGLKLVKKRGELMDQSRNGAMAAVIGMGLEQIEEVLNKHNLSEVEIANYNSASQIVVAGKQDQIHSAKSFFEAAGAKLYLPLKVSGAFHSSRMNASKTEFEVFIRDFRFSELNIPVISNLTARPYGQERIRQTLCDQINHRVRWAESIQHLLAYQDMTFTEIGPGQVLTKLVQQIRDNPVPLDLPEDKHQDSTSEQSPGNTPLTLIASLQQASASSARITSDALGSRDFKEDHKIKYAYVTGAMYQGIASEELVTRIGRAGMLAYFGTGGLSHERIESAIHKIDHALDNGQAYGMNLRYDVTDSQKEEDTVDLFLKHGVNRIEVSAYVNVRPCLVRYRLSGIRREDNGTIIATNKIMAKISYPEVASAFLSPPPKKMVQALVQAGHITSEAAQLAEHIPMADDICAAADSGGHTNQAVAFALLPAIMKLRDECMDKYGFAKRVRVGAAGGIGTPEAAAAMFLMGADFILTGSINQCTAEAGTSDCVKDMLQTMNVQDTDYAPSGDMFEWGAKVQVLKKGVFFPSRANKLFELYTGHESIEDIAPHIREQLEDKYFQCTIDEVYEKIKACKPSEVIERAEKNPKQKMAMLFKWYLGDTMNLAMSGNSQRTIDYQIYCGPALGAFNQWVKGTPLADWRHRHVDDIAEKLMNAAADVFKQRIKAFA